MTTPSDPLALLRSRSYVALLVLAAIIGVPISAAAYFFLALVSKLQVWIFTDLPKDVGFHSEPLWWPIPPLVLAGVLVALTIRYLPGKGGHSPADGFKVGGALPPIELGVVLPRRCDPEPGRGTRTRGTPIALGGGLGVPGRTPGQGMLRPGPALWWPRRGFRRRQHAAGLALLGAFLLMEAPGWPAMLELVLVPACWPLASVRLSSSAPTT